MSWAISALCALGYPCCPCLLQSRIDFVFRAATSRVRLSGTEVVPVALSEALNGKSYRDYVQRVEPSAEGARKMAALILQKLNLVLEETEPPRRRSARLLVQQFLSICAALMMLALYVSPNLERTMVSAGT